MAHPLGARFDIAHGVANALLLPVVMEFNLPAAKGKYAEISKAMGVDVSAMGADEAAAAAVKAVKDLSVSLGIPQTLREIGIPDTALPQLAKDAFADVCTGGNPRKITEADTYIDRATTGTNDNRAAFQQMLKDCENAAWKVVLVYAIDRFGRNSVEVALNKQRLKTNGKVLISATQRTSDNLDGTKNLDGILLENVYIGIAEYYSAELSQKILRGLRESRRKGQFCGGKIPYGYYVTDKKVQVDEEKAEVVRFIFRQYAAGVYVPKIICKLNEKGLLHNGKPFLPNAIYGILRNERYLGITRIRDEVYDNIYPQIVDADLYEKVKRKLIKNKIGSRSVKEVYLLRNKVKCGYCGNIISAECGTARNGETIRYYKCLGRKKHHNGCNKHPVRKEALEELVLDSVIEAMQDEKTMNVALWRMLERRGAAEPLVYSSTRHGAKSIFS